MGKLVSSIIMSLDGFACGPNGELDMFKVEQGFFDLANRLTQAADVALYGRGTYKIMQDYWPTAGDSRDASKHDKEHSAWYNNVPKYVLSTTLKSDAANKMTVISNNVAQEINKLKQDTKRNIQIFGSPGAVRSLMQENLIDEYWIFLAPVIIGNGIPIFKEMKGGINLKYLGNESYNSGMIGLHYEKISNYK